MQNNLNKIAEGAVKAKHAQSIQIKVQAPGYKLTQKHGKKYKYFDIASLTKAVFTVPVLIQLFQEKKFSPDKKVSLYLPAFEKSPIGNLPVRKLLDQTSGLVWWRPFYKKLFKLKPFQKPVALKEMLLKEKLKKNPKAVYSDLNFIILGQIISTIEKMPLDQVFHKRIAKPLKLKNTFFIDLHGKKKVNKALFAPTERNFRGTIQGEVHDENTASFGGISSHAGLFSTLDETTKMAEELLKAQLGKSRMYRKSAFKKFTKRAIPKTKGDWALGFMIPSKPVSTGGTKISLQSFGFTGFTGTSIWIDTKRKAVVVILSNRTYPTRKNESFRQTRRELHDAIWTLIDGKK